MLPSLGETSVRQTTIEELFGRRHPVTITDAREVATIKYDPRMAEVIRRACAGRISRAAQNLTFDVLSRTISVPKEQVNEALEKSLAGAGTLALGRELFTERLQRLAFRVFARRTSGPTPSSLPRRAGEDRRATGRRSTTGSMTVLGDLAQATGLSAQTQWTDAIRALDVAAEPKTFELTVGYRVPQPIMELANRLLPAVATEVSATDSIRTEGDEPRLLRVRRDDVFATAWTRPPPSLNDG